jgi:hypothetical protein
MSFGSFGAQLHAPHSIVVRALSMDNTIVAIVTIVVVKKVAVVTAIATLTLTLTITIRAT